MSVIRSRPIGILLMEDEKGSDAKIIAVPARDIDPSYSGTDSIDQIPEFTRKQIEHFFKSYKEPEPGKFVKILEWDGADHAKNLIKLAQARALTEEDTAKGEATGKKGKERKKKEEVKEKKESEFWG
jgi:inorganic pyrophosphatase